MTPCELLIHVAQKEVGVSEEPKNSNWGPRVSEYLKAVGIKFAAPWCMAFVVWCCKEAGLNEGIPKTGGVLDAWRKCKQQYRVTSGYRIGDILIFDFGGGKGHTCIVEDVQGSILKTIEGNTNDDGSREGYEVARRDRSVHSAKLIGAIRIV